MAVTTSVKDAVNAGLERFNLRLDTHTAARAEAERLRGLELKGHFARPAFPLLSSIERSDPTAIIAQVQRDSTRFAEISAGENDVGYAIRNEYFTTPDAEVLYALVQLNKPSQIVEVGSGNSTRLFRQAIIDSESSTRLTSIDPSPRIEISGYADATVRERVENLPDWTLFERLGPGDILFIDSSHETKAGNDLLAIVFQVLPRLRSGVLIHFHDVFLPYEYPVDWLRVERRPWTEQYLLQALLTDSSKYDVIWPGYYLQQTAPDFAAAFRQWGRASNAQSFWIQKVG